MAENTNDDPVRKAVRRWITQVLCREERLLILLHYAEQMTFREIGMVLDLSELRVEEMLKSLIRRCRDLFGRKE